MLISRGSIRLEVALEKGKSLIGLMILLVKLAEQLVNFMRYSSIKFEYDSRAFGGLK